MATKKVLSGKCSALFVTSRSTSPRDKAPPLNVEEVSLRQKGPIGVSKASCSKEKSFVGVGKALSLIEKGPIAATNATNSIKIVPLTSIK